MEIGRRIFHFLFGAMLAAVVFLRFLARMTWPECAGAVVLSGLLVAVLGDRFWEAFRAPALVLATALPEP